MIGVMSLWTKPIDKTYFGFGSCSNFCKFLSLSYKLLKIKYSSIFITDSVGKQIAEVLGITNIRTDLNKLNNENPNIWALGKVYSYTLMTEPFVNIDMDVLLTSGIDYRQLAQKEIIFQCPESPYNYREVLECQSNNSLHYIFPAYNKTCYNFGIIGGTNYKEIVRIANLTMELYHNNNKFKDIKVPSHIFEQYYMSQMLDVSVNVTTIYKDFTDAYLTSKKAEKMVHAMSDLKVNDFILSFVERKLKEFNITITEEQINKVDKIIKEIK